MDIGKAFTFVFDDDRWIVKILVAAAILALGVLLGVFIVPAIAAGLLLAGYGIEITRRVLRGASPVLPEWENWGDLLTDGIKMAVIGIVYALPIIIASACLSIPTGILAEEYEAAGQFFGGLTGCINFLWGLVISLFLPAAAGIFVATDDWTAAFRFGEVFALVRDNFPTYLLVMVMAWVAGFIGWLGILVCGVGWLVTAPYAGWITSHLYGQAYLEATGQAPQPVLEEEPA